MTTSAGVSNPNYLKRLESLLALALQSASNALAGIFSLQNRAVVAAALDNQATPAAVIIAAVEVVPRTSGLFAVNANWQGHASAADTITLIIAEAVGPPTGFSGGTVEQAGGGPRGLPVVRYALAGAVVATSANPTAIIGENSVTVGAAGNTAVSVGATVALPVVAADNPSLVFVKITAPVATLSTQSLALTIYELP